MIRKKSSSHRKNVNSETQVVWEFSDDKMCGICPGLAIGRPVTLKLHSPIAERSCVRAQVSHAPTKLSAWASEWVSQRATRRLQIRFGPETASPHQASSVLPGVANQRRTWSAKRKRQNAQLRAIISSPPLSSPHVATLIRDAPSLTFLPTPQRKSHAMCQRPPNQTPARVLSTTLVSAPFRSGKPRKLRTTLSRLSTSRRMAFSRTMRPIQRTGNFAFLQIDWILSDRA